MRPLGLAFHKCSSARRSLRLLGRDRRGMEKSARGGGKWALLEVSLAWRSFRASIRTAILRKRKSRSAQSLFIATWRVGCGNERVSLGAAQAQHSKRRGLERAK